MSSLLMLNGPNLNMLGTRQPEIYGTASLDEIMEDARAYAEGRGVALEHFQSNVEGELVDAIHGASGRHGLIILNAGAYTHTSIALMDAISATGLPVIELHLSNIYAREEFRHRSYISRVAIGVIAGFGAHGCRLAVDAALDHLGIR